MQKTIQQAIIFILSKQTHPKHAPHTPILNLDVLFVKKYSANIYNEISINNIAYSSVKFPCSKYLNKLIMEITRIKLEFYLLAF